jgi:endonuclease/exonuclease/phosphatase family metal-dependent hydrolase
VWLHSGERGLLLEADRIEIMSFNVRGAFRDKGTKNAWRNRASLNVATIERYAPALIGLQECQRGNLETYRKMLPGYKGVQGPRYGNVPPYDFNAIFFDPGRLEVLDSGGFWLSETPERYSRSWQTRVARSANWVLFNLLNSGQPFVHLNTHLDHVSRLARIEGSRLILRRLAMLKDGSGLETPVVLTGDFNCRPGLSPYRTFVEGGFVDTYLAAGNEDLPDANTFHAFRGKNYQESRPHRKPRRLDWILLRTPQRDARVRSHRILRDGDEKAGIYPSDHYPVMAELVLAG